MSYYRGENCTCAAWHELECACDADWTDPVVYVLQDRVKELEGMLASVTRETDTRIAELEKFGNDYARYLRIENETVVANRGLTMGILFVCSGIISVCTILAFF